jgi:hypothetical protein
MLEYHPRYGYVNDFTIIKKDNLYHLFHITGERKKYSPTLTDAVDHVGHAVSEDLVNWQEKTPITGISGACFCLNDGKKYALLSRLNKIIWSDDLYNWSDPLPVSVNFEEWSDVYESLSAKNPAEAIYFCPRDPFVWEDSENQRYVMFFCTRVSYGDIFTRGCVGTAESRDLVNWKLLPPALGPGLHFSPESPHLITVNGKYHMFYHLSSEFGLRHAVSDALTGPYKEVEQMDLLPGYLGASETIKVDDKWLFFGRTVERPEYSNQSSLRQRSLSLPLGIEVDKNDYVIFKEPDCLNDFRGECLFDSNSHKICEYWQVNSGDWRTNISPGIAANRHEPIPVNSMYGSSNFSLTLVRFNHSERNIDLTFDLQIPSFNGNDSQQRGGFIIDGIIFSVDIFQKALFCQDQNKDILAFKTIPYIKNDKYYHFRVFRNDNLTQVYMDSQLMMYLPAYGDASLGTAFFVNHGDMIIKDLKLWSLNTNDNAGFSVDNPQGAIMNGIKF